MSEQVESELSHDDEIEATLTVQEWSIIRDTLIEYAGIQDCGDWIDKREAKNCRTIAEKIEEETGVTL